MAAKRNYKIGDTVWVYGIDRHNAKPTKGEIIAVVDLTNAGYASEHYVIEIPTHIEPLLEIRTWETISQDEAGPVGGLRSIKDFEPDLKFASKIGFTFNLEPATSVELDEDEVSADQIHAALEQAQKNSTHQPLTLKETKKPKRRFSKRKTKND